MDLIMLPTAGDGARSGCGGCRCGDAACGA